MVEIALSLAIIAFALVAIIGILPVGLSVQKDNREQTVINLDAAYLMDAIRHGPLGQDNLTNYIVSISNNIYQYQGTPAKVLSSGGSLAHAYFFTTNRTVIDGVASAPILTNGFNIIGLLSMPKYAYFSPVANNIVLWSNNVTAVFRAINAPAIDQGLSQASKDFAFQYQVTIELASSAESPFLAGGINWVNLTAPGFVNASNFPAGSFSDVQARALQKNTFEMRLTFRWPVLPNGQVGAGRQVFRSSFAGSYLTSSPPLPAPVVPQPNPTPLPLGQSYVLENGAYLFFAQPDYTTQ
jgi:hypothetical protein